MMNIGKFIHQILFQAVTMELNLMKYIIISTIKILHIKNLLKVFLLLIMII